MPSQPKEAEWKATLAKSYSEAKATTLIAAMKKAHPEKSIRKLSYMCNGSGLNTFNICNNAIRMASMKHRQKGALAKKMATAWAKFARTGHPSQPGLTWDAFDPARCQTMVFDNNCRMVDDPEGEVRKILLA